MSGLWQQGQETKWTLCNMGGLLNLRTYHVYRQRTGNPAGFLRHMSLVRHEKEGYPLSTAGEKGSIGIHGRIEGKIIYSLLNRQT